MHHYFTLQDHLSCDLLGITQLTIGTAEQMLPVDCPAAEHKHKLLGCIGTVARHYQFLFGGVCTAMDFKNEANNPP